MSKNLLYKVYYYLLGFCFFVFISGLNKILPFLEITSLIYIIPFALLLLFPYKIKLNSYQLCLCLTYFILLFSAFIHPWHIKYFNDQTLIKKDITFDQISAIFNSIIFLIVVSKINSVNSKFKYINLFFISWLVGLLSIFLSFIFNFDIVNQSKNISEYFDSRFSGFYLNQNIAGYVVVLGAIVIIQNKFKNKYLIYFLTCFGLLCTFSFTASFAFIIYLIINFKYNKIFIFFLFIFFTLFLINSNYFINKLGYVSGLKLYYLKNFLNTGDGFNYLTTNRQNLFSTGIKTFFANPYGLGLGYFTHVLMVGKDVGIHNTFLQFFGENGLLFGFIISLLYILSIPNYLKVPVIILMLGGHGFELNFTFLSIILFSQTIMDEE